MADTKKQGWEGREHIRGVGGIHDCQKRRGKMATANA